MVLTLCLTALLAPVLSPHDPTEQRLTERFLRPGSAGHPLGTDEFGRDILSRVLYGSRSALTVGVISVSIAVTIGLAAGLTAALGGRAADYALMLLMDSLLSFPTILLAITVVAFLGYGLTQVMVAVGVIFSPVFARLVRAEALSIKAEGYVESSRALGSHPLKTIRLHFLPNMMGKVVVQASITFGLAIGVEASLSFLGLGTQPPEPSWGLMLKSARDYLIQAPWLAVYPGLAVAFTVLSFNLLGDTISERLNPF